MKSIFLTFALLFSPPVTSFDFPNIGDIPKSLAKEAVDKFVKDHQDKFNNDIASLVSNNNEWSQWAVLQFLDKSQSALFTAMGIPIDSNALSLHKMKNFLAECSFKHTFKNGIHSPQDTD